VAVTNANKHNRLEKSTMLAPCAAPERWLALS
jgi:hypothetical protein